MCAESFNEERLAFMKSILAGHCRYVRDDAAKTAAGEVMITEEWSLYVVSPASALLKTAVEDLVKFMRVCMGVKLQVHDGDCSAEPAVRGKALIVSAGTLPGSEAAESRSGAYVVDVSASRVVVRGDDDRGAMNALYYLEDLMTLKESPVLEVRRQRRSPYLEKRITWARRAADLPEWERGKDPLCDEYLLWLAHAGFNGIVFPLGLRDALLSDRFPEFRQRAKKTLARLNELIQRAARYGIDVYAYVSGYGHPPEFFQAHPELKGIELSKGYPALDWPVCSSSPEGRAFYRESFQSLMKNAPGLGGVIFIHPTEGVTTCTTYYASPFMRSSIIKDCPNCRDADPSEAAAKMINLIKGAIKSVDGSADVIVWVYSWMFFAPDPQEELISRLDGDVTLMPTFEQDTVLFFRDALITPVIDYSATVKRPSAKLREYARIAGQRGMKIYVKTEYQRGWDIGAGSVPYYPVPYRWHERNMSKIGDIGGNRLSGAMESYTDPVPSVCLELYKWDSWSEAPEIDRLLQAIAARDFGPVAAPLATAAWKKLSDAVDSLPFSITLAYQRIASTGPACPFLLEPGHDVSEAGIMGYEYRLEPEWRKQIEIFAGRWREGAALLEQMAAKAPPAKKHTALKEMGVAKVLECCVRSLLHMDEFLRARDGYCAAESLDRKRASLDKMEAVLRRELPNAKECSRLMQNDSRIGYSGTYILCERSPTHLRSIDDKIAQVEDALGDKIPRLRAGLNVGRR